LLNRGWWPALLVVGACAAERDRGELSTCLTWDGEVAAALLDRCGDCHGGPDPAAGYDLTSYLGALGPGSGGGPNAVAGDAGSALLAAIAPGEADELHAPHTDLFPLVERWVVECELSLRDSRIHGGGILDPASGEFHGRVLRELRYDFDGCSRCHGEDFSGGAAGSSCNGCHPSGPTACVTCHGDLPASGAHAAHAADDGPLAGGTPCSTCHVVPESWEEPGHILTADGELDPPPAEVIFSAIAGAGAAYDPATAVCSGVYCHGDTLADTAGSLTRPTWTAVGQGQAACGTCHGNPPASHADDRCYACHRPVAGPEGIARPALHVDGALQVGEGCTDCHGGSVAGAAPPRDLAGGISTDLVTVGAHIGHVTGATRLRGPIPCGDCHLMPATVSSPGHIDTPGPAEVFPAQTAGQSLAFAAGSVPQFSRETATCSDVYCHGGGTRQAGDAASGMRREPVWTLVSAGEASCGACHGIPPVDGVHDPGLGLTDCAGCHPQTVDASGNILVTGGESKHIDGTVDF
jgi:predicted CxxxxCH...CXXCH cytochrome family protein